MVAHVAPTTAPFLAIPWALPEAPLLLVPSRRAPLRPEWLVVCASAVVDGGVMVVVRVNGLGLTTVGFVSFENIVRSEVRLKDSVTFSMLLSHRT